MATKYEVSTTMGDSLLHPSDQVYVEISPSKYLKKSVADLNVGDKVIFDKHQTRTSLEDVDPELTKSPRYALAKETIHEKNSRGEYIPKLRTMLLKGMADHGVIDDVDLNARALYEADDFTKEDYEKMGEYISGTLKRNGKERSLASVDNWLRGETLAPSDWEIFGVLGKEINPDFNNFKPYEEDSKGMYFNYELFVNIRRGIMRYLNRCKGTTMSFENDYKKKSKISLSPEYAIVFQHFINDKGLEHATARVTGIEKLLKRRQIEHVKGTNPHLGNGIVHHNLSYMKDMLKDYFDVMEDEYFLESYIGAFIEDFEYDFPDETIFSKRFHKHNNVPIAIPALLRTYGEDLDESALEIERDKYDMIHNFYDKTSMDKFVEATRIAFLQREMDLYFDYPNGTSLGLLEAYYRVRKSIPKRIFQFKARCGEFLTWVRNDESIRKSPDTIPWIGQHGKDVYVTDAKKEKINIRAEPLKRESKTIKEKYNVSLNLLGVLHKGRNFLTDETGHFARHKEDEVLKKKIEGEIKSGREYLEFLWEKQRNDLQKYKDMQKEQDINFMTRKEALERLKEYKLGRIVDRRWQDFVLEQI